MRVLLVSSGSEAQVCRQVISLGEVSFGMVILCVFDCLFVGAVFLVQCESFLILLVYVFFLSLSSLFNSVQVDVLMLFSFSLSSFIFNFFSWF